MPLLLGTLLLAAHTATAFYNSQPGRWLSRDPIEERGGLSLYGLVDNAPVAAIDNLGRARGGELLACVDPCGAYKRQMLRANPGWAGGGGVICCAGTKFICTWGADAEPNPLVRRIYQKCQRQHETTHLDDVECSECGGVKPYRPGFKLSKQGVQMYMEEMVANAAGKECYLSAKTECGSDVQCLARVDELIAAAAAAYANALGSFLELGGGFP